MSPIVCTLAIAITLLGGGCSSTQRTGTNFCRRLGEVLPQIGEPMQTQGDVLEQVSRYEQLLEVAPLSIEDDLRVLTDVIRRASRVDPADPDQLQELADAAYASNRSALAVAAWVRDTCAVDITNGLRVDPPRQPPVETTVDSTVDEPVETTVAPEAPATDSTVAQP